MSLAKALALLGEVNYELTHFAEEHADRWDGNLDTAANAVAAAYRHLDSDFYAEHEAKPLATQTFLVRVESRNDVTGDLIQEILERELPEEDDLSIDVGFEGEPCLQQ